VIVPPKPFGDGSRLVGGLTYYRKPLFGAANEHLADLVEFSVGFDVIVLKVAEWTLD
jgi:hypothetical protein